MRLYARSVESILALSLSISSLPAYAANTPHRSVRRSTSVSDTARINHSPRPRAPDKRFSAWSLHGEVGQDSLTPADSIVKLEGFGVGGAVHYRIRAGSNMLGYLGGGLHYASLSAGSSGLSINYTLLTLRPDFAFLYYPNSSLGVGGYFATDLLLLSGSASVKLGDTTASTSISSVSQMLFGPRILFRLSQSTLLGAQYGMGSGSIKVKESSGAFKSSTFAILVAMTL